MKIWLIFALLFLGPLLQQSYAAEDPSFDELIHSQKMLVLETIREARKTIIKLPQTSAVLEVDKNLALMLNNLSVAPIYLSTDEEGSHCSKAKEDGSTGPAAYVLLDGLTLETQNVIHICPRALQLSSSQLFQILIHETAHLAGIGAEKYAAFYEVLVQILANIPPYEISSYKKFGRSHFSQYEAWQNLVKETLQVEKVNQNLKIELRAKSNFAELYQLGAQGEDIYFNQAQLLTNLKAAKCWILDQNEIANSGAELIMAKALDSTFELTFLEGSADEDVFLNYFKVNNLQLSFYLACETSNRLPLYEDALRNYLGRFFDFKL